MSDPKFDEKELTVSLKKLILGFSPRLQNVSSTDEAQQVLLQLEELDENFHRYGFVKMLRSCIEEAVGPLIDEEITKQSNASSDLAFGQETAVNAITSKVLESQAFIGLAEDFKRSVSVACENLLTNYDQEFSNSLGGLPGTASRQDHQKKSEVLFSDGESSVGDSSSGHSTVFFNSEMLQTVTQNLVKKNPVEVRKSALRELSHLTGLLDVQSDVWKSIRSGLLDALIESDDELWNMSLKVFGRGLSSNNCNKELYKALVEFLSSQFLPGSKAVGVLPKVKQGLDCRQGHVAKLMKAFRLLYEFQMQIPPRYSERSLEEILGVTLGLLACNLTTPSSSSPTGIAATVSPLNFFTLLDPKATWFVKLMHGHFGRSILLKLLEKHRSLVESCVCCFVEYSELWIRHCEKQKNENPLSHSESQKLAYTSAELNFAYFVHSVSILSRLLLFEQGRKFFPVVAKTGAEPVTLTSFLIALINFISRRPTALVQNEKTSEVETFDPAILVTDLLKKLCMSEDICHKCICQDAVSSALFSPIKECLDKKSNSVSGAKQGESALNHIAELLSSIASTSCGRHHLLYGENQNIEAAPIHILVSYAKKAIDEESSCKTLVGSVIFVCRQLYSSCIGLLVMEKYHLHELLYTSWRAASREAENAATPTPTDNAVAMTSRDSRSKMQWEEMLLDNLLNFASTPKGLLLLQQTGALGECVSYMYSRYVRKLQVSKCEKFGYGYMMSQIASTAPGILALQNAGFIATVIKSLWGALEVVDDSPVVTPKSWPVTPIDKTSKKPFTNLINLLSSFLSIYEILGEKALPTQTEYSVRQAPDSVVGVLDRLVFVDSNAKISSLFNYEQSHVFGLRLLSIMTSCLDTLLLLETQYGFQAKLLQSQAENVIEGSKTVMIDMLSLERNYILVKTYLIGGPSERVIPSRTLPPGLNTSFSMPLFSSYPVPSDYIPSVSSKSSPKEDNELVRFLNETKKAELTLSWLEKCQKVFVGVLSSRADQILGNCFLDLLDRVVAANAQLQTEAIFSTSDYSVTDVALKNCKLSPVQLNGIQLTIRYGCHLKLLSSAKDAKEKLTQLIKKCTVYLQHQRMDHSNHWLQCLSPDRSVGFDWFVATIFLATGGNADRSWKFLFKFSSMMTSAFVWMQRIHCSVHLPASLVQSGIPPVFFVTCHNIEYILQTELPHVYSTFKMSGFSPAQICQQWIRQCFWNYLDWSQICQYLALCIVLGADYQVYLCIAILQYLHRDLMQQMQDKNLIVFIKEEPIRDFRVENHIEYMQQLEKKFRSVVLVAMQNITKA